MTYAAATDAVTPGSPAQLGTGGAPTFWSLPAAKPAPHASRWSASGWLLLRGGATATPGLGGGTLGASQAGVRIGYAIDRARRVTLYGRLASALNLPGRDAAIGIDWRPTKLPIRLVAEHRMSLDGGWGGPTIGAVGGIGPVPVPGNFRLEAYGEGGVILTHGGIAFGDGAVRLVRPVARIGRSSIALGAGTWAAAQPGAARVDIGPAVTVDVPVGGHHTRLSFDWRERVAGDASPASGPALTLGIDL